MNQSNRFGKRYITSSDLVAYAKSLFPTAGQISERLLEFMERHDLLRPVARVSFPAEIVRRWHKEDYPTEQTIEPIEGDTE